MSPLIKLSKINNSEHQIRKKSLNRGIISVNYLVLLIVLAFFIVFYLVEINKLASTSFKMRDLEEKIKELEEANKKLEIEIVDLTSLARIEKINQELGMVKANEVEYITPASSIVAIK